MTKERVISAVILCISLLIVVCSVLYTNRLARTLAQEEQERVKIWAEATERMILAEGNENIDFYIDIIERNTTIPVYMLDSAGHIMYSRNVDHPVSNPTSLNGPIEIRFEDELGQKVVQYIYYDESKLLVQLHYVPYYQFALIFIFILVAVLWLIYTQRSEQNRVWVGLSKETAHQLGTPISSLMAWQELLQSRYEGDELIPQMKSDILRLQTIANRFSKIGSTPELTCMDIVPVIEHALDYMRIRASSKVTMNIVNYTNADNNTTSTKVMMNQPLFEWVVENLIKNAIDAMDGKGTINCVLTVKEGRVRLDVIDTGKGIDRHAVNKIFQPGYSTKSRGWGLGLSLGKRIIENYHGGKLFVKATELGKGTTFRIELKQAIDC